MKPKTWSHPKFALLKRKLGISTATTAGILEGVWHLTASFHEETGEVPYDGEALVAWLELDCDGATLVAALVSAGWLNERDGSLFVHDWHDHKPNYVVERIRKRRYREQKDNNGLSPDCPRTSTGQSGKERLVARSATPSASASVSASVITRSKKRAGTDHTDRKEVGVGEIADSAAAIFAGCGYRGDKGGNLWGVAALMHTGIGELTEAEVFSAARGAKLNGRNKPAHFFGCLSETLGKRDSDLKALLKRVRIVPEWPQSPPPRGQPAKLLQPPPAATERTSTDLLRELQEATR